MVQPNFIPRTLRGVGGVRLIDFPGVVYPPEMLRVREGRDRTNGQPYTQRPAWGISSREAAALLQCSESAARIALHKKRVRCRMVREPGASVRLFWDRKQVEKIAGARLPIHESVPCKMVDSQTAADMLQVGRSSLYRYSKRKWLHPIRLRLQTPSGLRIHVYYKRDEVIKLKLRLGALHMRLAEMQRLLADMSSEMGNEEIA